MSSEILFPNLTLDYSQGNTINTIISNGQELFFPAIYANDTLMTTNFNNLFSKGLSFINTYCIL